MNESEQFLFEETMPWIELGNGMRRQIMGYNDNIMMVKVEFQQGALGALHHHPHSQTTYVVSGSYQLTLNGEERIIKPGDGFYAPSDVPHSVLCLEAGILVDAFSPVREDFLK